MWIGNPIPNAGHKVFPPRVSIFCWIFCIFLSSFAYFLYIFIIFCIFCWHDMLKGCWRSAQFITATAKCATKILSWLLNTWNGLKVNLPRNIRDKTTHVNQHSWFNWCNKYLPDLEFGRTVTIGGKIGCISANISGPKWKYIRAKWDRNVHNKIPFSKLLVCHSYTSLIRGQKLICSVWVLRLTSLQTASLQIEQHFCLLEWWLSLSSQIFGYQYFNWIQLKRDGCLSLNWTKLGFLFKTWFGFVWGASLADRILVQPLLSDILLIRY